MAEGVRREGRSGAAQGWPRHGQGNVKTVIGVGSTAQLNEKMGRRRTTTERRRRTARTARTRRVLECAPQCRRAAAAAYRHPTPPDRGRRIQTRLSTRSRCRAVAWPCRVVPWPPCAARVDDAGRRDRLTKDIMTGSELHPISAATPQRAAPAAPRRTAPQPRRPLPPGLHEAIIPRPVRAPRRPARHGTAVHATAPRCACRPNGAGRAAPQRGAA